MSEETIEWTKSQRAAITASAGSLLVSAAAGSGKTAVLAERCAHLICNPADPCGVDELLVVTFTNAAAAEMRERIRAALEARMKAAPSERLAGQLRLVEHAHIGTIDAFCKRLLRLHFSEAGVDPQFRVLDADEAALLRRDVARELADDRYARDPSNEFAQLVDAYADGRDGAMVDLVCRTHEMMCSLVSPRTWSGSALKEISEAGRLPLNESKLGKKLLDAVAAALLRSRRFCAGALREMRALGGFAGYLELIHEWEVMVSDWEVFFRTRGLDALVKDFNVFEARKAPPVKNDVPNKERAKGLLDSVKAEINQGELSRLLAFNSEQWRTGQAMIAPHAGVLLELAEEFRQRYDHAKANMQCVDFADLERKALNLLADEHGRPMPAARRCHADYRHVMVDEYQDVSEIQSEILRLVSTECVVDEGAYPANLFTVGDVKQSIYRFRLADPGRFQKRDAAFRAGNRHGTVIDLQENFRSRPEVLEAVNDVFRRLMTKEAAEIEYDQTHCLRAPKNATRRPDCPPMELHLLPHVNDSDEADEGDEDLDRTEREAILCAQIIGELKSQSVDHGDVAILLRSLKFKAEQFAGILRRHGIPVHHTGGVGFFAAQEVRDVIALLSLLDNQQQDIPLAAVLRSPLAALAHPEDAMATVRAAYGAGEDGKTIPFHQAVVRYAKEQSDATARQLGDVLNRLAHWRDDGRRRPLADLIWHIYDQTDFLAFVAGLDDGKQRVANLLHLHQRARQFGSFLKQGLHRFLSFLRELREETDLAQPSIPGDGEQAVRIMSIHAAKGLEFPVVLLPDLGKRFNLTDARGSVLVDRKGLAMKVVDLQRQIRYPSLSSTLLSADLRRQALAEEMRLLYVALTRAKERLILVGTAGPDAARKWSDQFRGITGALPPEAVLSGNSLLDWMGSAQAACGAATCKLIEHSAEQVQSWRAGRRERRNADAERLTRIARLMPLGAAPDRLAEADAVISRLEFSYPDVQSTTRPAAAAATSLGGGHGAGFAPALVELPRPAFVSNQIALSPTQIGDATHKALEHLDYRRSCDAADVRQQINSLVSRGLLNSAQAGAVDAEAIAWMAATPLGETLKANVDQVRREIAFAASFPDGPSSDPTDAVMLRGRIDLLFPAEGGVALVDYKTDRVTADGVKKKAESYLSQMNVYRDALLRVAGKEVKAVYLVFLYPRVVWRAEDSTSSNHL